MLTKSPFPPPSVNIGAVTIAPSGGSNTVTVGTNFSLVCSAIVETQSDSPTPIFKWFYGTNNGSVPFGALAMATVMGSVNTYISTLQFSPLQESHAGMYTCRLGGNARLASNAIIIVNGMFQTTAAYTKLAISLVSTIPFSADHYQWDSSTRTKYVQHHLQ